MSNEVKTCWKSKSTKTETPWGWELVWASLLGVNGKVLFLNKGHSTSLKYYRQKDEVLLVRRGRIRILWGDEHAIHSKYPSDYRSVYLKEGDSFCIQSGCPYRITAIEDSEVFEIGSRIADGAIKLFDDYGRATNA
jgi:mannose-6-phosphate isomerase-like protein (cupin superfamily)